MGFGMEGGSYIGIKVAVRGRPRCLDLRVVNDLIVTYLFYHLARFGGIYPGGVFFYIHEDGCQLLDRAWQVHGDAEVVEFGELGMPAIDGDAVLLFFYRPARIVVPGHDIRQ